MSPNHDTRARSHALAVLGLRNGADPEEIRKAWRKIAFKTHPDRNEGALDDFVKAKAAYDLLYEAATAAAPKPRAKQPAPPQPKPAKPVRPARPVRPTRPGHPAAEPAKARARSTEFTEEALKACKALLSREGRIGEVTDHLPSRVERQGRSIVYIVSSTLGAGKNRIAMPTAVLEGSHRVSPKIMSFNSSSDGASEIEVPQVLREKLFPGARSVRIRFGMDEPAEKQAV